MIEKIVVGTDGSDTAAQAVVQAGELASKLGASLVIVSAFDPVSNARLDKERDGAPSDVEWSINEREDVDAMLGQDDTFYPCLEINARFNISTYQSRIAERLIPDGTHAIAATIGLRLNRRHTFGEVKAALGELLLDGAGRSGVISWRTKTVSLIGSCSDQAATRRDS